MTIWISDLDVPQWHVYDPTVVSDHWPTLCGLTLVTVIHPDLTAAEPFSPICPDCVKVGAVWAEWNLLPDDHPAPVKTIAAKLGMSNADVARIVYPPETFGRWQDDQEP